jgi:hypothetical protein
MEGSGAGSLQRSGSGFRRPKKYGSYGSGSGTLPLAIPFFDGLKSKIFFCKNSEVSNARRTCYKTIISNVLKKEKKFGFLLNP